MGWTFTPSTRNMTKKDYVDKELLSMNYDPEWAIPIKRSIQGNNVWVVYEAKKPLAEKCDAGDRFIMVFMLSHDKYDGWGFKDICESSGPYQCNCPLSYLKLAPVVENQRWRDDVIKYHARKRQEKVWKDWFRNSKPGDEFKVVKRRDDKEYVLHITSKPYHSRNLRSQAVGYMIPNSDIVDVRHGMMSNWYRWSAKAFVSVEKI